MKLRDLSNGNNLIQTFEIELSKGENQLQEELEQNRVDFYKQKYEDFIRKRD
jgi:hypothetical protein